jgi:hypothetical protein
MKTSWLLVVTLAACGGAVRAKPVEPVSPAALPALDVAAVRDDLSVYTDADAHYLALVEPDPERPAPRELTLFYGDGTTFHQVPVYNAYADGLKFEIGFDDARIPARPAGDVKREEGKTMLSCWGTTVPLTLVPAGQAKDLIAKARFVANHTRWSPVALGKEGERYLYIDVGAAADNRNQYRVFTGKKGALQPIGVVESRWDRDEVTLTLKTKEGMLVVARDKNQRSYTLKPRWEDKKEDWSAIERAANWRLIFDELGVYPEGRSPTPCDPMLQHAERQ